MTMNFVSELKILSYQESAILAFRLLLVHLQVRYCLSIYLICHNFSILAIVLTLMLLMHHHSGFYFPLMQKLLRSSKHSCSKPSITLLKQQISNCLSADTDFTLLSRFKSEMACHFCSNFLTGSGLNVSLYFNCILTLILCH